MKIELSYKEMDLIMGCLHAQRGAEKSRVWQCAEKVWGKYDDKHGTFKATELSDDMLSRNKRYNSLIALIDKLENIGFAVEVDDQSDTGK